MRSLILCEGFDDVLLLGYYLFKTVGWRFNSKGVFAKLYNFPKLDFKRQAVEIYEKGNDLLGIWAVGGKKSDSTEGAGSVCKGIEEALEIMRAEGEAKGRIEGRIEGKLATLLQLVQDGILELSIGAERAGMSVEEFKKALNQS